MKQNYTQGFLPFGYDIKVRKVFLSVWMVMDV